MNFKTTSPEYGTDGMLPKRWIRRNEGVYLLKDGTRGIERTAFASLMTAGPEVKMRRNTSGEQFEKCGHRHKEHKLKPEQSFRGLHHTVIVFAAVVVAQKHLCALIDTAAGHPRSPLTG